MAALLAGWTSPLSLAFLGVVVVEALRARSPWVRTVGPVAVVGLVAVAVGQIHRAYTEACKRAFGERFITGLQLDRGHLISNVGAVLSAAWHEGVAVPFLLGLAALGAPRLSRTARANQAVLLLLALSHACPPSCWSSTSGRTPSPNGTSRLLPTGRSQRRRTARSCSAARSPQNDGFSSGSGPWGSWSPSCPAVRTIPSAPPGSRRRGSPGPRAASCSAGTGPSMSRRHSRRGARCSRFPVRETRSGFRRSGPSSGQVARCSPPARWTRADGSLAQYGALLRRSAESAAVGRRRAVVPSPRGAPRPATGAFAPARTALERRARDTAAPVARPAGAPARVCRLERRPTCPDLDAPRAMGRAARGGLVRVPSRAGNRPGPVLQLGLRRPDPPHARARRRALHPLLPAAGPVRDVAVPPRPGHAPRHARGGQRSRRALLVRRGAAPGGGPRESGAGGGHALPPAGAQPGGRLELLPGRAAVPLAGEHADLGVGRVPARVRRPAAPATARRAGRVLRLRRAVDLDLHAQHPGAAAGPRGRGGPRAGPAAAHRRLGGGARSVGPGRGADPPLLQRLLQADLWREVPHHAQARPGAPPGQRPLRAEHGLGHRGGDPAAGGGGGASRAGADPDRALQPARARPADAVPAARVRRGAALPGEPLRRTVLLASARSGRWPQRCTERWFWRGIWRASVEARSGCSFSSR